MTTLPRFRPADPRLPFVALAAALGFGCSSAEGWQPPAPSGTTYVYEYQGFKEKGTTAFGGVVGLGPGVGLAYGGAFSFHDARDLQGDGWKDPFAESTPIDGVRFNDHLGARGIPLAARVASPASAAPAQLLVPATSSSAAPAGSR